MTPYATLSYFAILAVVLVPMTVAGARGKADGRWVVGATLLFLLLQYQKPLQLAPGIQIPELGALVVFALYQWGLLLLVLRSSNRKAAPWWAIPLGLLPLAVAKFLPLALPLSSFGFAGISYVTFRALDALWMLTDGAVKEVKLSDFWAFLFFFPTISSGPIDRLRRFKSFWRRRRTALEFWTDLDGGMHFIFRGLLYKFIISLLLEEYIDKHAQYAHGIAGAVLYSYVYTLNLFFDFAGYSCFAIGVSRWFGLGVCDNFCAPFAATNIRDFWGRWHISLSTWFRDHVYTRFLLMAMKRKWFKRRETASDLAYFVSFGLMGIWHGIAPHYIIYGLYHATLMCSYDVYHRWKKKNPTRLTFLSNVWVARCITFHFVCFGLWIFSGHGLQYKEAPTPAEQVKAEAKGEPTAKEAQR